MVHSDRLPEAECVSIPVGTSKQAAFVPSLSLKVQQVLTHIETQYSNRPVWLKQIASQVGSHPDYLSRRFKKETGIQFQRYIMIKRVERAMMMFSEAPGKSIKEISYEAGFSSPENFSRVFKRMMGCSPKVFRSRLY